MLKTNLLKSLLLYLFILAGLTACCNENTQPAEFKPIAGFSDEVNTQLSAFLNDTKNETGRKIAVFDGDGTVLGQTPHYLADEAMYQYALEHPEKNKKIFNEMIKQSNVSIPYVQNRVKYIAGESLQFYRDLGEKYFKKYYSNKIYEPMREMINQLKANGFEIWIITASPEGMYQQFLSKELQIPITNIVGIKSTIRNGIITDEIVKPIPQDHGKKEAIETFVQDVPLLVAGNSRGDKEMIEHSSMLKMIVNPDEHIAPDQTESIADYAKRNNWLIVKINDVPAEDFPSVTSKKFGIRLNKTHKVEK
ncbi:MAG: haloacid dehalogenase-like hydrolase [Ignavibacteriae bacterium]|nr:haloacid dehalogenase-like hydrolase [Ignavibacteriota bacterium]NOG97635.1 haloacid dehalogenase-like hydrolase [Ignavibacteriota bacterium]